MYAASFPDDVEKFISIDIAGPTVRDHRTTADRTGDAIDRYLKYETLPLSKTPCYAYDDMIDIVTEAYAGKNRESAKILMRRGMAPVTSKSVIDGEGYHFARDLRLKVSLLAMFSKEQVLSYAENIKSEVLNIRGRPGMAFESEEIYAEVVKTMQKNAKRVVYEEIEGTHHLHLDTPERIVPVITEFLK